MNKDKYYEDIDFFDKPRIKKMKLKDVDEKVYSKKLKKYGRNMRK